MSLILLSSYPKSGNTWLRAIIASLLRDGGGIDINANPADTRPGADRRAFEQHLGLDSAALGYAEIAHARPLAWAVAARQAGAPIWIKAHDALLPFMAGAPLPYPAAQVRIAFYVVRDPRDVAVSFAHHFDVGIDTAIAWLADDDAMLDVDRDPAGALLPQLLSSWSRHVASWLDSDAMPVHLIRYEDLHRDAPAVLSALAVRLDLSSDADVIARAIRASAFDTLRAQERAQGFREREGSDQPFFRRGEAGGWRTILSARQSARIVEDHGAMMQRLGYPA